MMAIESCFVLRNRDNVNLETKLTPEEGEIISSADARCTSYVIYHEKLHEK